MAFLFSGRFKVRVQIFSFLSPSTGGANQIRGLFGLAPVDYMTSKAHIRWVLFASETWRSLGWDSIIYLAAALTVMMTNAGAGLAVALLLPIQLGCAAAGWVSSTADRNELPWSARARNAAAGRAR